MVFLETHTREKGSIALHSNPQETEKHARQDCFYRLITWKYYRTGIPPVMSHGGFYLASSYSQMDRIKDPTWGSNSAAGGAFGTKGTSC